MRITPENALKKLGGLTAGHLLVGSGPFGYLGGLVGEVGVEYGMNRSAANRLITNPDFTEWLQKTPEAPASNSSFQDFINWLQKTPEAQASNPSFQDFIKNNTPLITVTSAKQLSSLPTGTVYQDSNGNKAIKTQ